MPKVGDKIISRGCSDFLPSGYYDLRPIVNGYPQLRIEN